MRTIEIARRMAELEQDEALQAYTLAVNEGGLTSEEELEAAVYILQAGGDYEISYTCFLNLYRQGFYQEETLALLTGAFYEPNIKELKGRYVRNVKLLKKYPYIFRKNFPSFEELPIRFYPYNDSGYVSFYPDRQEFGEFVDIKRPVISRNFFKDLEKPILAADVYSQYELEYLRDNVRRSDYVGRENHLYLNYTDWGVFCSYLQCLSIRPLLEEEKIVFLIEDEISQYPIDFKERFGIDYTQYPVKPIGIREITRMIWLPQFQSHNGVFFFTEVLDGHPNLLSAPAEMFDEVEKGLTRWKETVKTVQSSAQISDIGGKTVQRIQRELFLLKDITDKDILIAGRLGDGRCTMDTDVAARITPALVFSPHFKVINYFLRVDTKQNLTILHSPERERIHNSSIFDNFKYIKTVVPFRRPTTSSAAAVRYMWDRAQESWNTETALGIDDEFVKRLCNRSYLVDWQNRLYQDSVLVRFEDGKLNPKATFTALAEFLDLPYMESMTYCSMFGKRDPESLNCAVRGFDNRSVYETYDMYVGKEERYLLEYFLRDVYEACGYNFQVYDSRPLDEKRIEVLVEHFDTIDHYIIEALKHITLAVDEENKVPIGEAEEERARAEYIRRNMEFNHENRIKTCKTLLRGLHFINNHAQELHMMPLLKLDPALLEQPLYH